MKGTIKKILASVLGSAMVLGATVVPTTVANAATNKVVFAPVNFNGKGGNQSGDAIATRFGFSIDEDKPAAWSSDYKISYTMYIPANLVKKATDYNKAIYLGGWIDLADQANEDNWASLGLPYLDIVYLDGEAKITGTTDQGDTKDVSDIATIEKAGDYYKVTVKDLPSYTETYDDDGNSKAVDTSVTGSEDIIIQLENYNLKADSFAAIDDVSLKKNGAEVFSDNYDVNNNSTWIYAPSLKDSKTISSEKFSGGIVTVKSSASVKKGKKTSLKAAVPSAAGKVTYKTSNKKIATVTSKGIVKGVKKGKATITVSAAGVSKRVNVTVK